MSEPTYRIKPLEWGEFSNGDQAQTIVGNYSITDIMGIVYVFFAGGGFEEANSIDEGKAKAEAYYRSRLLTALEPVSCKETT